MIYFRRDDTKVIVEVDSQLPTRNPVYCFEFDCEDQETAELLQRHLQGKLQSLVERMRRQAYDLGWTDKAAKKRGKRKDFDGALSVSPGFCGW